jgi:hypothetical protein
VETGKMAESVTREGYGGENARDLFEFVSLLRWVIMSSKWLNLWRRMTFLGGSRACM